MDRKVLFGLLAVGAAAVALSRGRRRRASFAGLGWTAEQHAAEHARLLPRLAAEIEEAHAALDKSNCREATMHMEEVTSYAAFLDGEDEAAGIYDANPHTRKSGGLKRPLDDGLVRRFRTMCLRETAARPVSRTESKDAAARQQQAVMMLLGRGFKPGLKGLGSPPEDHVARYLLRLEEGERALISAETAVVAAMAVAKGIVRDEKGVNRRVLKSVDIRYHLDARCDEAAARLIEASRLGGHAQAEKRGTDRISGDKRMDGLGPFLRDINATRLEYHKACHVVRDGTMAGLGLGPEAHGIRRTNASVQTGFKIKDALKAARKGWCDSAIVALREAEYQAGQATAHAKSTEGERGHRQNVKAQATRVAVNRAAREVKAHCKLHKVRASATSKRQGTLPF